MVKIDDQKLQSELNVNQLDKKKTNTRASAFSAEQHGALIYTAASTRTATRLTHCVNTHRVYTQPDSSCSIIIQTFQHFIKIVGT